MAHDPGLSAVDVQLEPGGVVARLSFTETDVENLIGALQGNDQANAIDWEARRMVLEKTGKDLLTITVDNRQLKPIEIRAEHDSSGVCIRLLFPLVEGPVLLIRSSVFEKLPRGHRQYISVRDADGSPLAERMLETGNAVVEVNIGQEALTSGFRGFLLLGVKHILSGYDHIAFLLALLVVGPTLKSAARIITSFTVAHSITLALAASGVARISLGIVEPLIALSVAYAGFENLVRRDLSVRWPITFAFGLIHGFGFASAVQDLRIGASRLSAAIHLLSFNLGVELGQVAIAAVVLPTIWMLRRRLVSSARYLQACSVIVTAAGVFWLVERLIK